MTHLVAGAEWAEQAGAAGLPAGGFPRKNSMLERLSQGKGEAHRYTQGEGGTSKETA